MSFVSIDNKRQPLTHVTGRRKVAAERQMNRWSLQFDNLKLRYITVVNLWYYLE